MLSKNDNKPRSACGHVYNMLYNICVRCVYEMTILRTNNALNLSLLPTAVYIIICYYTKIRFLVHGSGEFFNRTADNNIYPYA